MIKTTSTVLCILTLLIISGCSTPVAIDPATGEAQTAKYQAGFFYGPLDASLEEAFRVAIRKMDEMGYFRTGELHRDTNITIYARKVGDEKVNVRVFIPSRDDESSTAQTMVRIRVGATGNLPESQAIYASIRDAL